MDERNYLQVKVSTENLKESPPVDLVAVVDVSYSMGNTAAGVNDGATEYIDHGFSLLDLIKHAVKCVVKTLGSNDRLSLVKYDDTATVVHQLKHMNQPNQDAVCNSVDNLCKSGSTNIYAGLETALNLLHARGDKARTPQILFFTDGQPNCHPPGGELKALKDLQEKLGCTIPIHTFGFGQYTRLSSKLLYDIAI